MNINYSLINPSSDTPHGDNVYNMFILASLLAKDLGYRLSLHASSDVIEMIGKWYDSVVEVNNYDFKLYDDLKIKLWGAYDSTSFTSDGDVLLFDTLKFSPDDIHKNHAISVEAFDLRPSLKVIDALNAFNSFGPSDIVPEWNYNNLSSYNTGVVRWSGKIDDFKTYYIQKYYQLRDWFLENKSEMSKKSSLLKEYSSVSSHFICEHLLYQLIKHYDINVDVLENNNLNNYKHLKGTNKFRSPKLDYSIYFLLESYILYKQKYDESIPIKDFYFGLKEKGLITEIFKFKH